MGRGVTRMFSSAGRRRTPMPRGPQAPLPGACLMTSWWLVYHDVMMTATSPACPFDNAGRTFIGRRLRLCMRLLGVDAWIQEGPLGAHYLLTGENRYFAHLPGGAPLSRHWAVDLSVYAD